MRREALQGYLASLKRLIEGIMSRNEGFHIEILKEVVNALIATYTYRVQISTVRLSSLFPEI